MKCPSCNWRFYAGGIESESKRALILTEQALVHQAFCVHLCEIKMDKHAAELGHAFTEQSTRQTLISTTYTDVTGAAIASGNFTAGKKYLLVINAHHDVNNLANSGFVKVLHGTTDFADSESIQETAASAGERHTYFWWTVWTAVTGEGVKMQFKIDSGTNTIGIDNITMTAIKLDDDLTENTDWFSSEVTASTALTTTDSSSNNASVTFTPATAGHDWLVISKSRIDPGSATAEHGTRIVRSGEAASTVPSMQQEGEDLTVDIFVRSLFRVFNLGNASNTFTEKSFNVVANAGTREHSGIFAINLNKMKNHGNAWTEAAIDLSATDYATTVETLSFTPDVTGDSWIMGQFVKDNNAAADLWAKGRIQVDNVDAVATVTTDAYQEEADWDVTDELPVQYQTIENLTAAAHTIDLDGSIETAAAGNGCEYRQLMIVTMELAAAAPSPAPAAAPPKYEKGVSNTDDCGQTRTPYSLLGRKKDS